MWKYRVVITLSYREAHFIFDNGDEAIKFANTVMEHGLKEEKDANGHSSDWTTPVVRIYVENENEEA